MIACETLRPNPVPRAPFVVKKGSNTRRCTSAVIPTPVSLTSHADARAVAQVRRVMLPPSGMASMALRRRLVKTSRNSAARPSSRGRGASARCTCYRTSLPSRMVVPERLGRVNDFPHQRIQIEPAALGGGTATGQALETSDQRRTVGGSLFN